MIGKPIFRPNGSILASFAQKNKNTKTAIFHNNFVPNFQMLKCNHWKPISSYIFQYFLEIFRIFAELDLHLRFKKLLGANSHPRAIFGIWSQKFFGPKLEFGSKITVEIYFCTYPEYVVENVEKCRRRWVFIDCYLGQHYVWMYV